ncbi:unnamed protein product [Rotaria sordida]|uniref:poly(ADP-ribose) glycohydrolase n=1 Tax=Rotaria sordida TaxID=392033 RepID=A0A814ZQA9_9BILA|nr:unnamed protein product [Rotaria sordida]
MGCFPSRPAASATPTNDKPTTSHRATTIGENSSRQRRQKDFEATEEEATEMYDVFMNGNKPDEIIQKGIPLDTIASKWMQPPIMKSMDEINDKNFTFTIKPWKYDSSRPNREPKPDNNENTDNDLWDDDHVRMPWSRFYISSKGKPIWPNICQWLSSLKDKCDNQVAKFKDLKATIETCNDRDFDMKCLEELIMKIYSNEDRNYFMYITLSKMCDLVLTLNSICSQPLPLLRIGTNRSITMSQQQVASLLACAFFCLFPYRSYQIQKKEYENYQDPNFETLYQKGPPQKIEKLKCILHYFRRVTQKMPNGVITIQRFALSKHRFPQWSDLQTGLCDLHLTTGKRIEDINGALQVDFANKYIGGGVLGGGCVQEEIRFTICPEMLVSLLVCERMEPNECIFLIGCERYSSYRGYAKSFQFDEDYEDNTPRDNWGRRWCHVVAMDAIYFRNPSDQYQMKAVDRELLKAYTSFSPLGKGSDYEFAIATGNWGCGAFNGDKQLKAIIQLMAASEARRPLIYAAYGDKNLITSFSVVYDYLKNQGATVGDLYYYLIRYYRKPHRDSLFEYIFTIPVSSLRC